MVSNDYCVCDDDDDDGGDDSVTIKYNKISTEKKEEKIKTEKIEENTE